MDDQSDVKVQSVDDPGEDGRIVVDGFCVEDPVGDDPCDDGFCVEDPTVDDTEDDGRFVVEGF